MKRARVAPFSPDSSQRSLPQSTYGGIPSGDAEHGGCDLDLQRNQASAYTGQSSYSGYAKADFTQSTVNLVTCVLGAGALGYPFCFKECGLLLATVIMCITLVATRISYQLILHCAQLSMRKTYEGIAEAALGRRGRRVVEICIAAMNLGALVAFLDILADVLSAVAGTIIPPGAEPSRSAYLTGVTVLGALPVSLVVRDHALIAAMSNASVVYVAILALVVFCSAMGPVLGSALGLHTSFAAGNTAVSAGGSTTVGVSPAAAGITGPTTPILHMWHLQGVLVSLPVMAYGFTAHQYYMGIYSMLKAPSIRKMKSVTDLALLICAGVYWTMGVGGYASFGDRTAGDIIRNMGGHKGLGLIGTYARALKLCYGMAILGNIPLVIMPFYSLLRPFLPNDHQIKQSTANLASVCTLGAANSSLTPTIATTKGSSSSTGVIPVRYGMLGSSNHVRLVPGSAHKLKTSFGGEDEQLLGTDGSTSPDPLLPPGWQPHNSSSSSTNLQESQQQQQQQQPPVRRLHSLDPHLATEQAAYMLTVTQHCLVVFIVLGLGLASAVWLPNVELIFGLTGSTASVLVAFIIPALCFISLYQAAPELGSSQPHDGRVLGALGFVCWCRQVVASIFSSSSTHALLSAKGGPVLVVPELRAQWSRRHRLAILLLIFGLISGLLCTDAILSSIREEKAVVQLAQELVAHEAVAVEANRAQQKAREAAAAVDAVSTAAQQLGSVTTSTNQTLGALTAAAAALSTISNGSSARDSGTSSSKHSVWDLKSRLEQRKQRVAEAGVFQKVEAALSTATADITGTMAAVTEVVVKLDASIAQIKADAAAGEGSKQQQPQQAAVGLSTPAAAAIVAPDGTLLPQVPAAGSSHIVPRHGPAVAAAAAGSDQSTSAVAGGAGNSSSSSISGPRSATSTPTPTDLTISSSSKSEAFDRASEMAAELGRALGVYSQTAGSGVTAGRSLEQVRDSALSALTALNITAHVLHQVQDAVAAAQHSHKASGSGGSSGSDGQLVRELAVQAMQRALSATAASALAVRITEDALGAAASEETSELLTALTRVAQDLEKSVAASTGKASGSSTRKATSVTVTPDQLQPTAAAAGPSAGSSANNSSHSSSSGDVIPSAQSDTTAATAAALEPTQQQAPTQPTAEEAAAAAAARANVAAHADSASHQAAAAGAVGSIGFASANAQQQHQAEGAAEYVDAAVAAVHHDESAADRPSAGETVAAGVAGNSNGSRHAPEVSPAVVVDHNHPHEVQAEQDTKISSSGSSSINTPAGSGPVLGQHPALAAAALSPEKLQTAAALNANEAAKVRGIIQNLATVLSSSSSSSSGASNSTVANTTALAAAIQDAVAWTTGSKHAVLRFIVEDLGKTQPKVAQRVVDIVQDISTTDKASKQAQQQQGTVAAAIGVMEVGSSILQQQQEQQGKELQSADAAVAGPVVTVAADGTLQQSHHVVAAAAAAGANAVAGPVTDLPTGAHQSPPQPAAADHAETVREQIYGPAAESDVAFETVVPAAATDVVPGPHIAVAHDSAGRPAAVSAGMSTGAAAVDAAE